MMLFPAVLPAEEIIEIAEMYSLRGANAPLALDHMGTEMLLVAGPVGPGIADRFKLAAEAAMLKRGTRHALRLLVQYGGDLLGELVCRKRFGQEMLHVKSGVKVLGVVLIDVGRRENDMSFVVATSKIHDQLPAIDLGHSPIGDYQIKASTFARVYLERFTAVLGGENGATGVLQHLGRKLTGEFLIIYEEDSLAGESIRLIH